MPVRYRIPLFLCAVVALVTGLWGGLGRLPGLFELTGGAALPPPNAIGFHGALMAAAFFGTVISLERAVALNRPWAYLAPALCGLGGIALLAGLAPVPGGSLLALGLAMLVVASAEVWRRQKALHNVILLLAAALGAVASLVFAAGAPIRDAVPGWSAFLVLTIAGERLELSRLLPPSPFTLRGVAAAAGLAALAVLAGALGGLGADAVGAVLAVAYLALAALLVKRDVAWKSARLPGLPRYIAVCLLSGYLWLAAGALMLLAWGLPGGGPHYDAALHALFVGYVLAMVFGHAPIVLPAVAGIPFPYRPWLYAPLAVLHGSLLLRLLGDGLERADWRLAGGLGNGLAVLLFALSAALAVRSGVAAKRQRSR
ncbi:hypothetical protein OTERR_29220 [Oryzomicrobium terrae]|uniref:NnrS family protein n=1 Tax=Oryzomicrobium terrae TaxID=1735038 RepID=A0A5C1EDL6_9RHOO|nr:hypothetical protein [Oryzomicrobium terrae]QEL66398.1 hypothetical protein OTERR_29220 [Oryzomicrobium terrae]